mmetsp:Transcript_114590/g.319104  ORF Transcript_114590/g.319104 Transcript_114590/m.319104 type:complete len:171 (-) Transcript_114590:84-596(-)
MRSSGAAIGARVEHPRAEEWELERLVSDIPGTAEHPHDTPPSGWAICPAVLRLPLQLLLVVLLRLSAVELCALSATSSALRGLSDEPGARPLFAAWLRRRHWQAAFDAWQERAEAAELRWEILCELLLILRIVALMSCSLLSTAFMVLAFAKLLRSLHTRVAPDAHAGPP